MAEDNLLKKLEKYQSSFHPVLSFNSLKEKLIRFDFTEDNKELQKINFSDTNIFCQYIDETLNNKNAAFGIGGYNELRVLYSRSTLFNDENSAEDEPRRLHLGTDIWGKAGTEIFAPLDGIIHSFAFNDNFGDYGATIILQHQLEDVSFYTLHGHLSLADLQHIKPGDFRKRGQLFAHFGSVKDNGHWPPHLHFQVINDIGNCKGDYPGVCKFSERENYLINCPDPDLILNMNRFL